MPTYDRVKAATYGLGYALYPNPAYAFLASDCTNFVSQALLAGGWTMAPSLAHDITVWWYAGKPTGSWVEHYISGYASETWTSASQFYRFLNWTNRVCRCEQEDFRLGDIVQARDAEFGMLEHTMMVTSVRHWSQDVGLSYHTNNRLEVALKGDLQKRVAFTEYIYWKVLDQYPDVHRFSFARRI